MTDTPTQPAPSLATFTLDDLAAFKREGAFDPADSGDARTFYVGRDDVHGILEYLLSRCSRSLYMNMFGYDDDQLNGTIAGLVDSSHVFVQGTLDKSQSGGVHERALIANWDAAVRASFAIGQSATHQISHTKGGVIDGKVAWAGSTNWSASGEGNGIVLGPLGTKQMAGYKAQNNTLDVFVNPVEIAIFTAELNEEHATALSQQVPAA